MEEEGQNLGISEDIKKCCREFHSIRDKQFDEAKRLFTTLEEHWKKDNASDLLVIPFSIENEFLSDLLSQNKFTVVCDPKVGETEYKHCTLIGKRKR